MRRLLTSLIWPTVCGVLIAVIFLDRIPQWRSSFASQVTHDSASQPPTPVSSGKQAPEVLMAPPGHPDSYAMAVSRAAPAVVSVYSIRHGSPDDKRNAKDKTTAQDDSHKTLLSDPRYSQALKNSTPTTGTEAEDEPAKSGSQYIEDVGSGVILSREGYVLTNQHVINRADEITVTLRDGRTTQATVVGVDNDTDLAVLKITLDALPVIALADSSQVQVGDIALAIGNPFNFGQTVTMGIISATGRNHVGANAYENFIQTDAAINPGNSGGALINTDGALIGINTVVFSQSGGAQAQGIGFAIPTRIVHDVLDDITTIGYVQRGWLGMDARRVPLKLAHSLNINAPNALVVTNVLPGTPAADAGLQVNDLVLAVDDTPLIDAQQAIINITQLRPGTPVKLRVFRQESSHDVVIHIGTRPSNTPLILNAPP